jgi:hypothetical protein
MPMKIRPDFPAVLEAGALLTDDLALGHVKGGLAAEA